MDFVLETILPATGRFLAYLIVDIFLHGFCYVTGYVLVKLGTLGKKPETFFPKPRTKQEDRLANLGLLFWCVWLVVGAIMFWG